MPDPATTTTPSRHPASTSAPTPWHVQFPAPRALDPPRVSPSDVLSWLQAPTTTSTAPDYILIDLRRTDHEGGTIRGSLNIPAQTLHPSIPTLYGLFRAAGVAKLVFWCSSSRGRGPRAAGWFEDYIVEREGEQRKMRALVLEGGIKGWVAGGEEYTALMDGYREECWGEIEGA